MEWERHPSAFLSINTRNRTHSISHLTIAVINNKHFSMIDLIQKHYMIDYI